jgi:transposase
MVGLWLPLDERRGSRQVTSIPTKSNRRIPIPHDRVKYRWRNLVERLFSKLKNWRRVATRHDKTKESYLGFVALASIKLWLPFVHDS